ncbi:MAG: Gfo/Idh/MocA family oxidoreductase [Actinomycetota bacterium]|nr:Gfo/Idh/MocA family oxidoreductase [Actinomycetota bacterium]
MAMGSVGTHSTKQTLLLVGAGPIGLAAALAAASDGAARVIGVIDPEEQARQKAGEMLNCTTYPSLADLEGERPDVALVAFTSAAAATVPTVISLVARGCHVVTTCEELAYPPEDLRDELVAAAKVAGVAIVVTGANPGFVMDRLATVVALAGRNVHAVTVVRRLDTRTRRGPLVAKTGYGLPVEEFRALAGEGRLGHVGLKESANLVAEELGWSPRQSTSTLEPVLGDNGEVLGQHQVFTIDAEGSKTLVFDLEMSWGAPDPGDRITVNGDFDIDIEVHGGYPGDEGTTAMVVRAIGTIGQRSSGFYRPTDLVAGY